MTGILITFVLWLVWPRPGNAFCGCTVIVLRWNLYRFYFRRWDIRLVKSNSTIVNRSHFSTQSNRRYGENCVATTSRSEEFIWWVRWAVVNKFSITTMFRIVWSEVLLHNEGQKVCFVSIHIPSIGFVTEITTNFAFIPKMQIFDSNQRHLISYEIELTHLCWILATNRSSSRIASFNFKAAPESAKYLLLSKIVNTKLQFLTQAKLPQVLLRLLRMWLRVRYAAACETRDVRS